MNGLNGAFSHNVSQDAPLMSNFASKYGSRRKGQTWGGAKDELDI